MKYRNPVVRGFYPDPSICRSSVTGKYYLVTSSFQYFPGVPVFESEDLVNYKQVGHVLTGPEQVMLEGVRSSGGVFAPTIREHAGRFYMVTNNNSTAENFYVYTDDIYGEWSEPIVVDQEGIDPSLLFDTDEDGTVHCYFISNGVAEDGRGGIMQCEINVTTGEKLSETKCIWQGSGGRYLESPHMYRIGDYYYIMAAEGGTEYGHMITYARGTSVWGPFEDYPHNPVLTNRNKAPFIIQGIGHGDLIEGPDGNWYMVSLGFRQQGEWMAYHSLGRETFLTPAKFGDDGWFTVGDGTTDFEYDIPIDSTQLRRNVESFETTSWDNDWVHLRIPDKSNYVFSPDSVALTGSSVTLEDVASPTFIGIRQKEYNFELSVNVNASIALPRKGERLLDVVKSWSCTGITVYLNENEHYDLAISSNGHAILRLNIGGIKHIEKKINLKDDGEVTLICRGTHDTYTFYVKDAGGKEICLGSGRTKYLSSEVDGGFTGVMLGLFAEGHVTGTFTDFKCTYTEDL